jgi:hypothetical protein
MMLYRVFNGSSVPQIIGDFKIGYLNAKYF